MQRTKTKLSICFEEISVQLFASSVLKCGKKCNISAEQKQTPQKLMYVSPPSRHGKGIHWLWKTKHAICFLWT